MVKVYQIYKYYELLMPNRLWTYETCKEEALKYKTKSDFSLNNRQAYYAAWKYNYLDDICKHMIKKLLPREINSNKTINECQNEALKYIKRTHFQKYSYTHYMCAKKNNWLNDICKHMTKYKKNVFTFDECLEEAKKYNSKTEFSIYAYNKYYYAVKKNWIYKIFNIISNNKCIYNRCIYVYEFENKHVYVGLTTNLKVRNNQHKNKKESSSVYNYILKNSNIKFELKQLTDYIDEFQASNLEKYYINLYKKNNWIILNIKNGGNIGSCKSLWDYEKCKNESLKYKNRNNFKKYSGGAYEYARKYKILNDICLHMNTRKTNLWSIDKIYELIKNYNNYNEFFKNNSGAYAYIKRNKFCKEIKEYFKNKNINNVK